MSWTGVVTNGGSRLLDRWAEGVTLHIDSAATGAGRVAAAALMAQTAITNRKQTASIISCSRIEAGYKVKLQITASETGYNLTQYGIWAKIDDEDPVLIAIFQSSKDIPIPSREETPDFVYTFYALLSFSNTGKLEINIDTSALVTHKEVAEYLKRKADLVNGKVPESQLPEINIPEDEEMTPEEVRLLWGLTPEDGSAVATVEHGELSGRDAGAQHPIEAISGLNEIGRDEVEGLFDGT